MTRVKKLEWSGVGDRLTAPAFGLATGYRVTGGPGQWLLTKTGSTSYEVESGFETQTAAKAAAQADYEARILACLEPAAPTVAEAARVLLGYELTPETEDAMSDAAIDTGDGLWIDGDRGACVGSAALVNAWRAALSALAGEGKP